MITGSEIEWEFPAKVYKYRIDVSKDNANWSPAVDKTGNTNDSQLQRDSFTMNARYVSLTVTGLDTGC